MSTSHLLTEAFALSALCFNMLAYKQQSIQRYRLLSGIAMLLLSIHFFRLEAYAASVGCGLAVIRNIVSLRINGWVVTFVFIALNLLFLAYEWFALAHGAEILLAYSVSIIFTVGTFRLSNTDQIKKLFFGAELLSIIYCIIVSSIFGMFYGLFNAAMIIYQWVYHPKDLLDISTTPIKNSH